MLKYIWESRDNQRSLLSQVTLLCSSPGPVNTTQIVGGRISGTKLWCSKYQCWKTFKKKSIYAWLEKNAQGVSCSTPTPHTGLQNQMLLCTGTESTPGMWNASTPSAHTWDTRQGFRRTHSLKASFIPRCVHRISSRVNGTETSHVNRSWGKTCA